MLNRPVKKKSRAQGVKYIFSVALADNWAPKRMFSVELYAPVHRSNPQDYPGVKSSAVAHFLIFV